VCRGKAARGEAALRAKACRGPRPAAWPRGEAAALRARGETARGEAASCRGKAARGEAAYNLVFI